MRKSSARRAIVIHNLDHAREAVKCAAATGVAVAVWSAPCASAYLGAPFFRDIVEAAVADFPAADAIGVLDCGDDAGFALSAFRHGLKYVHVDLAPGTLSRVTDIARQQGAIVVRERPVALDLLDCPDAAIACRKWLLNANDKLLETPEAALPTKNHVVY